MGDAKSAAMLVPALPDTEEGIELKGQVAERLGQWDLAVDLYGRLPSSNPRRCELLRTAREQWRLVNAPPYLTRALGAKVLPRKGLAAILVWKAPELASQATGPASVFEDIVNLNERRDIITVVRSGVMAGDPVTRRFGAEHSVTPRELQAVLGRLATALGRRPLTWCDEDDQRVCVTASHGGGRYHRRGVDRRPGGRGGHAMSAPVVDLLAANPLFAELAPSELEALATAAERHEYSRDETVFAMQQPADGLYVLVSGRVKVCVSSSGGKEIILATLGPGQFFGEMALLDNEPRSASVVTQLPTTVYRIRRADFERLVEAYPSIARKLLRKSCRCACGARTPRWSRWSRWTWSGDWPATSSTWRGSTASCWATAGWRCDAPPTRTSRPRWARPGRR